MGMARIFGLCAALLFASSVTAANIIDLGPTEFRRWGSGTYAHTLEGLRSSVGQTVRMPPMNTSLSVSRNPVIPYGSIANGMRNFVRITPGSAAASAAVTGLFLAMDWYFDSDSGEWVKDGEQELEDPDFGLWSAPYSIRGPTPDVTCTRLTDHMSTLNGGERIYTSTRSVITGDRNATCYGDSRLAAGGGEQTDIVIAGINRPLNCPANYTYDPSLGSCISMDYMPTSLTGSDFSELANYLPSDGADRVGKAADDTMKRTGQLPGYHDTTITGPTSVAGPETTSTSTDPLTGDSVVTSSTTTTNISYGDTTVTTTNTTVSNTYTNGQHTSSETTTETPGELPVSSDGGGAIGDWPGFCDWATVVCDWISWTQEEPPPEQDLPQVIDEDFFEQKRISFGSKSCPPDHEINLAPFLETTVGVSFQPLCDFAGLIYYMVMMASYIIAAYISIGVARNA